MEKLERKEKKEKDSQIKGRKRKPRWA